MVGQISLQCLLRSCTNVVFIRCYHKLLNEFEIKWFQYQVPKTMYKCMFLYT